jgi:hypothetical protein
MSKIKQNRGGFVRKAECRYIAVNSLMPTGYITIGGGNQEKGANREHKTGRQEKRKPVYLTPAFCLLFIDKHLFIYAG